MRRFIVLAAVAFAGLALSANLYAIQKPDAPGTKYIQIQAGALPGYGAALSGNISIANLGSLHLYGGLQLGADFRSGFGSKSRAFSLAPRFTLGMNLSRVVEMHVGGLAGAALYSLHASDVNSSPSLKFCYAGLGGFRFSLSPSFALVAEGCYSMHLPYAHLGIAFQF